MTARGVDHLRLIVMALCGGHRRVVQNIFGQECGFWRMADHVGDGDVPEKMWCHRDTKGGLCSPFDGCA